MVERWGKCHKRNIFFFWVTSVIKESKMETYKITTYKKKKKWEEAYLDIQFMKPELSNSYLNSRRGKKITDMTTCGI